MAAGLSVGSRQVAACVVLLAFNAAIATAYGVIAVPLGREFHPSRMVLMLAMTVMAAVSGLLSPMLGAWMDRFSLRRMMFAGTTLLGLGFVAVSFAASFPQVLLAYALLVAPANVLMGPMAATVLLSRWYARRRGAAIGIAVAGIALGGFVFPPIVQLLVDEFAWRGGLRVFALLIWGFTIPAVALVVNRPGDVGLHPDAADAPPIAAAGTGGPPISNRAVLTDPTFWCAAVVFCIVLSGMKGMVTNLVPLAVDEGISPNAAALLISIYSGLALISKLSFAAVADSVNQRILMTVSLGGFMAGMACLTQASGGYWTIVAGVGLVGLFGGLMVPMQGLLVPRIYGAHVVGRVAGLLNFVLLCALLTTPPLFGAIYDLTGDYDAIFVTFAVLAAAALFLVAYIRTAPRVRADTGVGELSVVASQ